jgi:hypothetical protein
VIVAFRKHTLLPLDDCLYALHATVQQLTRLEPPPNSTQSVALDVMRFAGAGAAAMESDPACREKFSYPACGTITASAPSYPSRSDALAQSCSHMAIRQVRLAPAAQPSGRDVYARECLDRDVLTLADRVGAAAATVMTITETHNRPISCGDAYGRSSAHQAPNSTKSTRRLGSQTCSPVCVSVKSSPILHKLAAAWASRPDKERSRRVPPIWCTWPLFAQNVAVRQLTTAFLDNKREPREIPMAPIEADTGVTRIRYPSPSMDIICVSALFGNGHLILHRFPR